METENLIKCQTTLIILDGKCHFGLGCLDVIFSCAERSVQEESMASATNASSTEAVTASQHKWATRLETDKQQTKGTD